MKAQITTMFLYGVLIAVIIAIVIFATMQQKAKTEQGINKTMGLFSPSKMETVVISSTLVGSAAKRITLSETDQADGTSTLARAVVDCYRNGFYTFKQTQSINPCYTIDASNIKYSITEDAFNAALATKGSVGKEVQYSGWYCGQNYEWEVEKPLTSAAGEFTICYDLQTWKKGGSCDDVFLTKTPDSHCD